MTRDFKLLVYELDALANSLDQSANQTLAARFRVLARHLENATLSEDQILQTLKEICTMGAVVQHADFTPLQERMLLHKIFPLAERAVRSSA
jgi:hypothetical protein